MTHFARTDEYETSFENQPARTLGGVAQAVAQHKALAFLVLMALTGMVVWPFLQESLDDAKNLLTAFRSYCQHNPLEGHLLYTALFAVTLALGLPVATLLTMLIGLTYGFGEAVALVMVCRMSVAGVVFLLARHSAAHKERYARTTLPYPDTFKRHPALGLALMRLAPLPDSVVSYGMGKSSMRFGMYMLVSFLFMLPVTVALVWAGQALGSIQHLIRYLA